MSSLIDVPASSPATSLWSSGLVRHHLADHADLDDTVIARIIDSMPADRIEYNDGRLDVNQDPDAVPDNGRTALQTLHDIETAHSWIVLKEVESHPELAPLIAQLLDSTRASLTDELAGIEAFLFVSSPGVVTPFHSDPEHNILLQIRGSKTVHVWPCTDRTVFPWPHFEAACAGAHRNLPYDPAFEQRGQVFELTPGQGLYMPPRAPHWVENGPQVSVSLSFTWRTAASERERRICMVNGVMRRAGLPPRPVGESAWRDACKLRLGQAAGLPIAALKRSPRLRARVLQLARGPSQGGP